jgi:hypothetical protein
VLAQHYEKATEYRRASECYRIAGDKAQETTSVNAAVDLYERGETALQMLHEDRPSLRNKWKYFVIWGGTSSVSIIALCWIFRLLKIEYNLLELAAIAVAEFLVLFGVLAFQFNRWSFLVYPDRIRIRSKRRTVDIPFERITGVRVVSSRGWGPRAYWTFFRTWPNPWYPKYGWGQVRVMGGLREIIRLDCASRWRKGYFLDMENPRAFLLTLNRSLERDRAIRDARLAVKA